MFIFFHLHVLYIFSSFLHLDKLQHLYMTDVCWEARQWTLSSLLFFSSLLIFLHYIFFYSVIIFTDLKSLHILHLFIFFIFTYFTYFTSFYIFTFFIFWSSHILHPYIFHNFSSFLILTSFTSFHIFSNSTCFHHFSSLHLLHLHIFYIFHLFSSLDFLHLHIFYIFAYFSSSRVLHLFIFFHLFIFHTFSSFVHLYTFHIFHLFTSFHVPHLLIFFKIFKYFTSFLFFFRSSTYSSTIHLLHLHLFYILTYYISFHLHIFYIFSSISICTYFTFFVLLNLFFLYIFSIFTCSVSFIFFHLHIFYIFSYSTCKYHISNDVLSRCKSVHREKWWWIDTIWQQDENWDKKWKIRNSGWNMIAWWQSMTRTPMTSFMIAWHCTMRTRTTTSTDTHMSVARIVSSVAQCHIICTRTVAQVMSLSLHPHVHGHLGVSLHLDSPILFPAFPHSLFLLPPAPEVRRKPVHSAQREYGLYWRVLPLHRLWAQLPRLQRDLSRALHAAPGLAAALLRQSLFCGPRLRWRCTRGYAPPSTSSASLSLSTRRLVCQSVVVVNVR